MTVGVEVGTDIVSVPRIARLMAGQGFLQRCFTPGEIAYCSGKARPEQHFAARFAAKEAVLKVLRCPWDGPPQWRCAEVVCDDTGAPGIVLTGRLLERARSCDVRAVSVSLSHCTDYATATAVVERVEHAPAD